MSNDSTALVIGAGQSGLAASHFLTAAGIDHVVLERDQVASSWKTQRWDSLRLLTPNWQNRLPGFGYDGDDPDGYMTSGQAGELIERFAKAAGAPVRSGADVTRLVRAGDGYQVTTGDGELLSARAVIIASGAFTRPAVPALAAAVPERVVQADALSYKEPGQLPPGRVLVVGASATGVQLAAEIAASGRPVTLAVGEHTRMPRCYRGRDVLWWMDKAGIWDQRYTEVEDLDRARRLPSPQLAGTPQRATLDLNALQALGVELVGRLAAIRDGVALFSGGLKALFSLADLKMHRLLGTFDEWADGRDLDVGPPQRFDRTSVPAAPRLQASLASGEIGSVVWATGYRPDYGWLDVPVVDDRGRLAHDGGVVTRSPGLYALGLPVLRRRKSTFLYGAGDDARDVVGHLARYLAQRH